MDFIRVILTLLLPVSFISALILMILGVPQTLDSSITITPLESALYNGNNTTITETTATIIGPVASLESIKLLGNNGGSFFGSNSAYPFENPTGLSNLYEMFLM